VSTFAAVALYLNRQAEQLPMIFLQPFEMRFDRSGDFPRVLYRKKVPHNLTIMFGLTREAKRRILLLRHFRVGHYLDLLRRFPQTNSIPSRLWNLTVHQR